MDQRVEMDIGPVQVKQSTVEPMEFNVVIRFLNHANVWSVLPESNPQDHYVGSLYEGCGSLSPL
jgi:hypothetical protein